MKGFIFIISVFMFGGDVSHNQTCTLLSFVMCSLTTLLQRLHVQ